MNGQSPTNTVRADVVIAGGSTAALAAAFAAAEEGAQTVLIEPTDWIGGQLTASAVSAIDEAWHKIKDEDGNVLVDVSTIARDARNMNPALLRILNRIGNPGRGWVSRFCFEPKKILKDHLLPWENRLSGKLTIFRETTVKRVETDRASRQIIAIEAIHRHARPNVPNRGYDRLPSEELADWYAPEPSNRFAKSIVRFEGNPKAIFIDATEWGEVLALSKADYLQGVDVRGEPVADGDSFGQATVFGFVQRLHDTAVVDSAKHVDEGSSLGWGKYAGRQDAWQKVWTYRRIRHIGNGGGASAQDLSLQNWGYSVEHGHGGNDYPFGYLLLNRKQTDASVVDWVGGVNLEVIAEAENRAYAWHAWTKSHAPTGLDPARISMATDALGTGHGLSKLPYVRDTRRSVGIDGFVLKISDLVGKPDSQTGTTFADAVAIGAYPADVHHLVGFDYPDEVMEHVDTRPFCIPFRALTNNNYGNLLVAGKTMAQGFMANSATRLHPIEWSTGTAAGVSAAWMKREDQDSAQAYAQISELRRVIAKRTPIRWTLPEE